MELQKLKPKLLGFSVLCLRLVSLHVPSKVIVGDVIKLTCRYDLEGDILYSIKCITANHKGSGVNKKKKDLATAEEVFLEPHSEDVLENGGEKARLLSLQSPGLIVGETFFAFRGRKGSRGFRNLMVWNWGPSQCKNFTAADNLTLSPCVRFFLLLCVDFRLFIYVCGLEMDTKHQWVEICLDALFMHRLAWRVR
ncbi:hypothetical protein CEXT_730431 [Caerostris extrusa]|uniref:Uncharacterized protein n=1 Tax=Caerostris extrusa TaxID=172846 RepID=A0AAV4NF97_CAEEX|nr:hypothetical protein CEXT_730431 [Caerostris extrusa]